MRSSTECGCFPYGSQLVCYMELFPDGTLHQLQTASEKREAFYNANQGISKIVAVWPGRYRSDLFIIDDLVAFCKEQRIYGI